MHTNALPPPPQFRYLYYLDGNLLEFWSPGG